MPIRKLVTVAPPLSRLHLVSALLSAALVCALVAYPAAGKQPGETPPGQAKPDLEVPDLETLAAHMALL